MTEIVRNYLLSVGFPVETVDAYDNIVKVLERERETDEANERTPLPKVLIPGIAFAMLEKTLCK